MESKQIFIESLTPGMSIDQVFLVRQKDLRTTKRGDLYINLSLADKTGQAPAVMWQANETIFEAIEVDGFIQIKGSCADYRGNIQIVVEGCMPVPADKIDLADFLPVTTGDIEAMWSELLEIIRAIRNPSLRLMIKKFVEDKQFVANFKRSPAAMQMHHPFIGGLLEHTLGLARIAKAVLPLYPKLNADLILAGVFLHDAAKTAELSADASIKYTDRGKLVGHITIGAIWVHDHAQAIAAETGKPFPQQMIDLLQHMILSHHGEYEFGSPKLPMIPEAFFLHYIDNLDAKMWMTLNAIEKTPDQNASFTPYLRAIEGSVYRNSGTFEE